MTKKERQHIEKLIAQYLEWQKQTEKEAAAETDPQEREELWLQARLNDTSANTLFNLLIDLDEMKKVV